MTKEETRQLLQELEKEGGLWDKERLLGEERKEGSLRRSRSTHRRKIWYITRRYQKIRGKMRKIHKLLFLVTIACMSTAIQLKAQKTENMNIFPNGRV